MLAHGRHGAKQAARFQRFLFLQGGNALAHLLYRLRNDRIEIP
jgi:hypothetical protein